MAHDPYEPRRGWRDRSQGDHRYPERGQDSRAGSERDERGFFERAGQEISSWFGDDDHDRDERFDRDDGRSGGPIRQQHDRSEYGARERGEYRPVTGDYGRDDYRRSPRLGPQDYSRAQSSKHERTSDRGSTQHAPAARGGIHDPHYSEWRQRQIDSLDRDYEEYRHEHQTKFEQDFVGWRDQRQSKRQMLGQIRPQMEVVGSDEQPVGTVERVAGDRIILARSGEGSSAALHSIPCTAIDRVEGNRVTLDETAEHAHRSWRDESRSRALFEREDQGEAGPHILDRSFSGTYR